MATQSTFLGTARTTSKPGGSKGPTPRPPQNPPKTNG